MLNLVDVNIKCISVTVVSERCDVLSDIINVITSSMLAILLKSETCKNITTLTTLWRSGKIYSRVWKSILFRSLCSILEMESIKYLV